MFGSVIMLALLGAVAGWLATRIMDVRMSVPQTVAIGVLGALAGGFVLRFVVPLIGSFIGAVACACLLIWLIQRYGARG